MRQTDAIVATTVVTALTSLTVVSDVMMHHACAELRRLVFNFILTMYLNH